MILDEILHAERFYRERYRQENPRKITLSEDYYEQLCEELGVDQIDVFHGMDIEVTNDVETFMIEENEIFLESQDEEV